VYVCICLYVYVCVCVFIYMLHNTYIHIHKETEKEKDRGRDSCHVYFLYITYMQGFTSSETVFVTCILVKEKGPGGCSVL